MPQDTKCLHPDCANSDRMFSRPGLLLHNDCHRRVDRSTSSTAGLTSNGNLPCPFCFHRAVDESALDLHLKDLHRIYGEDRPFGCNDCLSARWSDIHQFAHADTTHKLNCPGEIDVVQGQVVAVRPKSGFRFSKSERRLVRGTTAATVRWEKYLGKPNIVVPDNFQHSLGVAPSASRLGRRHAAIYGHRI